MIFGRVKSLDAILATADYTYTYAVMGELLASSQLGRGQSRPEGELHDIAPPIPGVDEPPVAR